MKLNKTQINVLANSLKKEIDIKLEKENLKAKELQRKSFSDLYEKGIKILKDNNILDTISLNVTKNTTARLNRKNTLKSWMTEWSFRNLLKIKSVSIKEIEEDIILATIDSQSIEDIMKVLRNKYK
jgi:hypothetical protein